MRLRRTLSIIKIAGVTPSGLAKNHFGMAPANKILISARGEKSLKESDTIKVSDWFKANPMIQKYPKVADLVCKEIFC